MKKKMRKTLERRGSRVTYMRNGMPLKTQKMKKNEDLTLKIMDYTIWKIAVVKWKIMD